MILRKLFIIVKGSCVENSSEIKGFRVSIDTNSYNLPSTEKFSARVTGPDKLINDLKSLSIKEEPDHHASDPSSPMGVDDDKEYTDLNCLKCGRKHYVARWNQKGDWRHGLHDAALGFFTYGNPRFIGMTQGGELIYLFKCPCGTEIAYASPKPPKPIYEEEISDFPISSALPVPTNALIREYTLVDCFRCGTTHTIVRFDDGFHEMCGLFRYGNFKYLGRAEGAGSNYLFTCPCGGELPYTSPAPKIPPKEQHDHLQPKHCKGCRCHELLKHDEALQG
ncbi:hypothetical protein CCACVL1_25280 [Corchorus capsularis]|uniref:Uncharacterized protein n=1 Tax=Corchorus capsularis TaxID=210143 RepID=A0A1R3GLB8_COCAP|nr:hypothetical protein CCACVL1_25280 [Corchorus capsularis]